MRDPLDALEWDGDEHMTPEEQSYVRTHRAELQRHAELVAAAAGSSVDELTRRMHAWWSALLVITQLHEFGIDPDGPDDPDGHSPAFRNWWAHSMNDWYCTRQSILQQVATNAGFNLPWPEDIDSGGGDLMIDGRLIGAFSFQHPSDR